jgi:hypothetical protein
MLAIALPGQYAQTQGGGISFVELFLHHDVAGDGVSFVAQEVYEAVLPREQSASSPSGPATGATPVLSRPADGGNMYVPGRQLDDREPVRQVRTRQ